MPPLIVWTFGAIGVATVTKWVVRKARHIRAAWQQVRQSDEQSDADRRPTLRRDPATGIYSPK
jgi:hypothetical protein